MIPTACPHCHATLRAPEKLLGRRIACPRCGKAVTLPQAESSPRPEETRPARAAEPEPAIGPAAEVKERTQPGRKRRKKKKKKQGLVARLGLPEGLAEQRILAAICMGGLLLVGLAVFFGIRALRSHGTLGGSDGAYVVVDELPDLIPAADDPKPFPEPEVAKGPTRAAWSARADPMAQQIDYAHAVGAATPEQSVLLAAQGGPYMVGVPVFRNAAQRFKNAKSGDPARPWKVVSLANAPFPVMDIRTGKEVGAFPVSCHLNKACRLSSDGQYLVGWQRQTDRAKRMNHDIVVVWKRGSDRPLLRWPVPGPVFWAEFCGPERLALAHGGLSSQFVVLDVSKGAPVVSVPLPAAESPATAHPARSNNLPPFTQAQYPCGAVSPGGHFAALAGKDAIVVFRTADGQEAGRLVTDPEAGVKDYWAVAFDETGAELRAGYTVRGQATLCTWSMHDGQLRHRGPFRSDKTFAPVILSGPEPGTLIVGQKVVDLQLGRPIAEVPPLLQRWAGPDLFLAQLPQGAINAKALAEATDYQIMGGSFVTPFKRAEYLAKAAPFAAARAKGPVTRPPVSAADRTGVVAVRMPAHVVWAVKASPSPALPAEHSLEVWPQAFAATEAASVPDGRHWVRYDLKTGKPLGHPIQLWPDTITDLGRSSGRLMARVAGGNSGRLVALSLDGKRLAIVDPSDRTRVDVWDVTGKHLLGLRPYSSDPIAWLAWTSGGQLLTACNDLITGWDAGRGKAVFEIEGTHKSWILAPGCTWLATRTRAGNLDFFDAQSGKPLGRIPVPTTFSIAPDGKTLVHEATAGAGSRSGIEVWNLETGTRSHTPEVPIDQVLGPWVSPRCTLRLLDRHGQAPSRYLLYDLDAHTHTYAFAVPPTLNIRNDSFGRAWIAKPDRSGWGPVRLPGTNGFRRELAFGPGSTIRVEVNVGPQSYSKQLAEQTAARLRQRGLKLGRNGWVLRADHTIGTGPRKYEDPMTGKRDISVLALTIRWELIAPDGTSVWHTSDTSSFDPFRSKYVKVGSRTSQISPMGGGYQQVRLDFQGKDPRSAQIEDILEQKLVQGGGFPPGLPACLVQDAGRYELLPIQVSVDSGKKP